MSKISRNAPCPCGSGKKYKKCCLNREEAKSWSNKAAVPQINFSSTELEEFFIEHVNFLNLN